MVNSSQDSRHRIQELEETLSSLNIQVGDSNRA